MLLKSQIHITTIQDSYKLEISEVCVNVMFEFPFIGIYVPMVRCAGPDNNMQILKCCCQCKREITL